DKQTILAISQAIGALAGGLAGGNLGEAATGSNIARNAVENNWLTRWQSDVLQRAESACEGGNKTACSRAEELRALDQRNQEEMFGYVASVRETMLAEGVPFTEEEFGRRMDAYWKDAGVSERDVVYTGEGHRATHPTDGQKLYELIGAAPDILPDWYPGKSSAALNASLGQGVLGHIGDVFAAWNPYSGDSVNWFTGEVVSGSDARDIRIGSAIDLATWGWSKVLGSAKVATKVTNIGNATPRVPELQPGSFSISDWTGYPSGVPRPQGPFRIVEGTEYDAARTVANKANSAIRRDQGLVGQPVDIHEVQPVKFGGSPTDPANKVVLPRDIHRRQVTPWWNKLQKDIGK
ncbi:hypothetical protein HNR76_003055, partial [Pseudoxanthomonas broegbernensis]